jgi:Predicted metal-dependent hydrolase
MKEKIIIHPQIGEILIVKGGARRNIRLTVHPVNGVRVSTPPFASFKEAERFIESKVVWILKAKARMAVKRNLTRIDISDGARLPIIGGAIRFMYHPVCTRLSFIPSSDNSLFHLCYGPDHSHDFILLGLTEFLKQQARLYLPDRLSELAAQHGFSYNKVSLKNNRSNWGSCSAKGNINLNIHLMRLHKELCDYVIFHELCHLRHRNHGPEFHALLDKLCNGKEKNLSRSLRVFRPYIELLPQPDTIAVVSPLF